MLIAGSMLIVFYAALVALVWAYFGATTTSLALALVGTIFFAGFQYKFGKWAALRSVGAEDMPEDGQYQQIHWTVEDLSKDMGIEKPRLMVAEMGVPNAFAVGRRGAGVVVVSRELMQILDEDELNGVLAHELAHINNRDVVMMVMGQSIASMIGIAAQFAILFSGRRGIGNFFLAMFVGQIAQMLVMVFVFAISRYREYVADEDAAGAIGRGEPLARALEKIENYHGQRSHSQTQRGRHNQQQSGPGTEDKIGALCIFNEKRSLFQKLFSTHPPTEKRIQRLRGY
jgi:heat shock protein HtpX